MRRWRAPGTTTRSCSPRRSGPPSSSSSVSAAGHHASAKYSRTKPVSTTIRSIDNCGQKDVCFLGGRRNVRSADICEHRMVVLQINAVRTDYFPFRSSTLPCGRTTFRSAVVNCCANGLLSVPRTIMDER